MANNRSRTIMKAIIWQKKRGDNRAFVRFFSRRTPVWNTDAIETAAKVLEHNVIAFNNAMRNIAEKAVKFWKEKYGS